MRSNYQQGQSTVFGMVIPRLIRWRSRAMTQRSHAAWQEAARVARTPIIYTATEENCPLPTHGVAPCLEARLQEAREKLAADYGKTACPDCRGTGADGDVPCGMCSGRGTVGVQGTLKGGA